MAQGVSILGHPLLTLAIFTLLLTFRSYDAAKASFISVLIIVGLVIPIAIRNYSKVKNKKYTNFDVSDRRQRQSFYSFGITLLSFITFILYFIPGTRDFFIGTLCALLMTIVSAIVNLKIKISMHTSFTLYLAVIHYSFNIPLAWILCGCTFLIALSRLILKRHTLTEIIAGAVIGLIFGLLNNHVQLLTLL